MNADPVNAVHTVEPWKYAYGCAYAGDVRIALADREAATAPTERDANVRRLVACVNACAGVSTDTLETMGLGGLAEALIHVSR